MDKKNWMLSLQVGDVVSDCRNRNLYIQKIYEVRGTASPKWWRNFIWHERMPLALAMKLSLITSWFFHLMGWTIVIDKDLILEDGSQCSAMNCCDPVD